VPEWAWAREAVGEWARGSMQRTSYHRIARNSSRRSRTIHLQRSCLCTLRSSTELGLELEALELEASGLEV